MEVATSIPLDIVYGVADRDCSCGKLSLKVGVM